MANKVEFEYRNKREESIFETFLRYSNEKEKSSTVLGRILGGLLIRDGLNLLDIGSGNGEYLKLSLAKIKYPKKTRFTLLEPSKDLLRRLRVTSMQFPECSTVKVICSAFEDFIPKEQFDVILASHVPLAKDRTDRLPGIYQKMLELLNPDGSLIIVLRGKDDIHEFRTTFKSQLMGITYQSITIEDAAEILNGIAMDVPLSISMHSARAKLRMPYPDNMPDVISIIEFFLNRHWDEIPSNIRKVVMNYIHQKNGVFNHLDGFAVVRKKHSSKHAP